MRRTFVVEEGTILLETGMGLKKTQRTPPIAHHCTLSLTRLVHLLTRPSPGRVAYHARCAPVCAEQGCDIQTSAKVGLERPCLLERLHVVHAVENVGVPLGAIHLVSTF